MLSEGPVLAVVGSGEICAWEFEPAGADAAGGAQAYYIKLPEPEGHTYPASGALYLCAAGGNVIWKWFGGIVEQKPLPWILHRQ